MVRKILYPTARSRALSAAAAAQWPRLLDAIRHSTGQAPATAVVARVVEALRANLPTTKILTARQLQGHPERYAQFVLHVEPGGLFSIVALVWRPDQVTPIHDHVSWCVVGVLQGGELETRYVLRTRERSTYLKESGIQENCPGSVCGLIPPGDIHRVRNNGTQTAVSLHIYGADISTLGSSIRRCYDLPIQP
jgi:predicted metal-dependent enzyme (double-stranded beta helix superfamily)